jgi:hypothetical protein
MAEPSRDTEPTKPESVKKQPETVQLTAEELRAIAGGAGVGNNYIPPVNDPSQVKGGKPSGGKHG